MALFTENELINKSYKTIQKSYTFNESVEAKKQLEAASKSFSTEKKYDIFLSHSILDERKIIGLKNHIEELGYSVYVDWIEDKQLDRSKVSKETANLLRTRMESCKSLFFAVSENSDNSLWMPWELGYFDGIKQKVAILPILKSSYDDNYNGQEYLGLYPFVARGTIRNTNREEIWVHKSKNEYVQLRYWLQDSEFYNHG
ncbi:toll/interleukin-1 receptor domain-containing protein [Metabacillus endolithicus]|uniref:Toll/interleukin-1 receptor domain-containing protein n=1 Tax=Metabacillus endolithicus TaxID=1535204 RepID=A0ABW5C0E8_9BACI|nr:toll/interleukin-1 receptor domain-containing protein [Metabacillus endolithicus]UPG61673.1 toll/interleukin-1 receptor domain-containing protein [Metabacillus endolithicus]